MAKQATGNRYLMAATALATLDPEVYGLVVTLADLYRSRQAKTPRNYKPVRTKASRAKQSEAMKKYWAERRRNEKKNKTAKAA